ncbi:hypothetical protein [Pseudodesulfovibrio sp.]|uniref:hypothetical protein n=1 Tax=unclassified Pseudodesulfovibrio TaxID=2661612 RepID=UPI003B0074B4
MTPEEHNIAEEMGKMEYEPLQPIELKLIRWSLIIGVVSLLVLFLVSQAFFPGAHGA